MKKRVVITGIGAVTPIGLTVDDFFNNALNGICGIDYIDSFDVSNSKVKIAAEIKNLDATKYFKRKQLNRLDRYSQFALIATREAYSNAKLYEHNINNNRMGVIIGTGVGGQNTLIEETTNLIKEGMHMVSPLLVPKSLPNIATGNIAIEFKAKGITSSVITACAAGTNAIGEAYRAIQYDDADIMITGGSEACINPLMLAGFTNLKALSLSNNPKRASIPFDLDRDGFVMGEGAGILILEELEHALSRNASIYAEIVGYGFSSDAYHLISPDPNAEGCIRSMQLALSDANIEPSLVSYINAHGTSTSYNDVIETTAIKKIFKKYAYKIPINSTKSLIGHLLGAAGAVEAIMCIKSLISNSIHPTIGYKKVDPDCDLDYVISKKRNIDINYVLSNSFGFGGHNATLIFKKYKPF